MFETTLTDGADAVTVTSSFTSEIGSTKLTASTIRARTRAPSCFRFWYPGNWASTA